MLCHELKMGRTIKNDLTTEYGDNQVFSKNLPHSYSN